MEKVIIISVVVLILIGLGFGAYFFFFAEKDLFELDASEISSIALIKDDSSERIVFDSKEDIQWFVTRLNNIKYERKDISHSALKPDDTDFRIDIEGEDGGTYHIGKHLIRRENRIYHLTDESKEIVKEIMGKLPQ